MAKQVKNDGVIKVNDSITLTINKSKSDSILFYATFNLKDCIYIKGLKLIEYEKDGKTKLFLGLPSYAVKKDDETEYQPFVLFNKKLRATILNKMVEFYHKNEDKFKKDDTSSDVFDEFID